MTQAHDARYAHAMCRVPPSGECFGILKN